MTLLLLALCRKLVLMVKEKRFLCSQLGLLWVITKDTQTIIVCTAAEVHEVHVGIQRISFRSNTIHEGVDVKMSARHNQLAQRMIAALIKIDFISSHWGQRMTTGLTEVIWCQDRKSFITEKKKLFLPKYRNLYNFRTINLHELYKFTAVHHNIPKETKTEHDKDVLDMRSQDRQLFFLGKLRLFFLFFFSFWFSR